MIVSRIKAIASFNLKPGEFDGRLPIGAKRGIASSKSTFYHQSLATH